MNNPVILSVGANKAVRELSIASEKFEKAVNKLVKLEILKAKGASIEELEELLKD